MQRNPSANSATTAYVPRSSSSRLPTRRTPCAAPRADLPRITQELEDALAQAERAVAESQKPIDAAKATFTETSTAADAARDAYQTAREEAEERQRALKGQISDQEKEKRAQEQAARDAADEATAAQEAIDEAEDIHAHPEVTETIAARLEADCAEREEQAAEVASLTLR